MRRLFFSSPGATLYIILSVCIFSMITINSCRKIERQTEATTENELLAKFFSKHQSNVPLVLALNKYLQRENSKYHFVEKVVKQIGFPRWDKAIIVYGPVASGRGAADSAYLTYIPFVRDSQNHVNASMAIRTTLSDTTFSYLCDWQYQQLPNNLLSTTDSAEIHALFFMMMNNIVFNYKDFFISDTALFKTNEYRAESIHIEMMQSLSQSGRMNVLPYGPICIEYALNLTQCNQCPGNITYQQCWEEYYGVPGNGTGGGGTGGGSGGSGNGGPPPCGTGNPQRGYSFRSMWAGLGANTTTNY